MYRPILYVFLPFCCDFLCILDIKMKRPPVSGGRSSCQWGWLALGLPGCGGGSVVGEGLVGVVLADPAGWGPTSSTVGGWSHPWTWQVAGRSAARRAWARQPAQVRERRCSEAVK